jgi:hypothetical protein
VIGASAEGCAFAGHDEHAAFAIVTDGMQMALEVEDHVFVEAIAARGPIEGDRGDRTVILDEEILSRLARRHSCCFTSAPRSSATLQSACAPAIDIEQSLFRVFEAERRLIGQVYTALVDRLTLVAPETLWLHEINAKDGLIAEELTLEGSAADGSQIDSTSFFMLKLKAALHRARAASHRRPALQL